MDEFLSADLRRLRDSVDVIVRKFIAPEALNVDRDGAWPERGLRELARERITGLTVPAGAGGLQQGLLGLATLTEALGRGCASTMCFGMHCVASAVIAAKATAVQTRRYLVPIANGEHLTTLALSEAGSGSQFFLPQTALQREPDAFTVRGTKQFVTNGRHVDSYGISTLASGQADPDEFSCLVVDADTPSLRWGEAWDGFGMRGNASTSLILEGARVPHDNLLGEEGEQVWYAFEVVAPYFLPARAGTYVRVAQAALDLTVQHLKTRRFSHSGQLLGNVEVLQHRLGEMWARVTRTRLMVRHGARLGDLGAPEAMTAILACKAEAADTAVWVTNEAMTMTGGSSYRENSTLARLLRHARASHVMSPTTDILWIGSGRTVLGLPLL